MADSRKLAESTPEEAIRVYKNILMQVIDQRPSGMRQRLADALGKHRSFVTQIIEPVLFHADTVKTFAGYLFRLPFQPG